MLEKIEFRPRQGTVQVFGCIVQDDGSCRGNGCLINVQFEATTAALCNGFMEFSSSERVEIPQNFEEATVDHLVQLIGISHLSSPILISEIMSPFSRYA